MAFRLVLGSLAGRLLTGVLAMALLVWLAASPGGEWHWRWVPAIFFAAGLALWICAERFAAWTRQPHPQDEKLVHHFRRQVPSYLRIFLRKHDFADPFHRDLLHPLEEIAADWKGAEFEFSDRMLQGAFARVLDANGKFTALIADRIHPADGNSRIGTPKTEADSLRAVTEPTKAGIRKMNAQARRLAAAIDRFERVARERVPTL
ncbi:hypothetical protein [Iodidimonas sp. SYSU 1G8]|uniref:hypothetical protein n=1 Tax=Iodidimonas sp. SYSU 1G8 TaxID=3133967 RepID=UPI0031FF061D